MTSLADRALSAYDDAQNALSAEIGADLRERLTSLFGAHPDEITLDVHEDDDGDRITYAQVGALRFVLPPMGAAVDPVAPAPVCLFRICECNGPVVVGELRTLEQLGQALRCHAWTTTECLHAELDDGDEEAEEAPLLEGVAQLIQGPDGGPVLALLVSAEDMQILAEQSEAGARFEFALYQM